MPQSSSSPTHSSTSSQTVHVGVGLRTAALAGASSGCRRSRNRQWDVRTSAVVNRAGPLQMPQSSSSPTHGSTSSQMPSACRRQPPQGPPHSPRASSWLPSQSQSPLGCQNSRSHRSHRDRCRCRKRQAHQHMGQHRRRCRPHRRRPHKDHRTRQGRRAGCRRSHRRLLGCQQPQS